MTQTGGEGRGGVAGAALAVLALVLWVLADADGSVFVALASTFVGGIAAARLWDVLRVRTQGRRTLHSQELVALQKRLEEAEEEIMRLRAPESIDAGRRLGDGQESATQAGVERRERSEVPRRREGGRARGVDDGPPPQYDRRRED